VEGFAAGYEELLQDYQVNAVYPSMRKRAMGLLMLHVGIPVEQVSRVVGKSERSLQRWVAEWRDERMASLYTGHIGNRNAAKLSQAQHDEVMRVLQTPPTDPDGLPVGFWSLPRLKDYIATEFEVVLASDSSYQVLLHHAGLSFKQPAARDQRRPAEEVVAARVEQIRDLVDHARAQGHLVFAADEVRIEHEALTRRAWCRRGVPTVLEVDRQRRCQSYIGFLNQADGSVELTALDWQNSHTIIDALTQLVDKHPGQKITIVWDNAGWHKSRELKQHLGKGNRFADITLLWLPPYCPDHNPIEHVWSEAKTHISNLQRPHFTDTRNAFETYIRKKKFPYRL